MDSEAHEGLSDHCRIGGGEGTVGFSNQGGVWAFGEKLRHDRPQGCRESGERGKRDKLPGWLPNSLHDRGVREKRAKIMKEGKVLDLVEYLSRLVGEATGIPKVVLLMDRAAVLYLWESWARGKKVGELEARQIDREDGITLPDWSKTVRSELSGRVELAKSGQELTFLEGSAELLAEMESQRIELGRGFLFRPLTTNQRGFRDEPLKSGALKKRAQQHLEKANLFEGETLHSFRRSAVQHAAEIEGYNVEKLVQKGRWKSYSAFKLYIEEIESRFGHRGPGS
jgi:integrase